MRAAEGADRAGHKELHGFWANRAAERREGGKGLSTETERGGNTDAAGPTGPQSAISMA